ncbi:MAG TPA: hypothetical protein VFC00_14595 [Micromonosporaceae bacterium]|nr:hypothetical protein [Micromonosporaceae bacterium]
MHQSGEYMVGTKQWFAAEDPYRDPVPGLRGDGWVDRYIPDRSSPSALSGRDVTGLPEPPANGVDCRSGEDRQPNPDEAALPYHGQLIEDHGGQRIRWRRGVEED